MSDNPIPLGGFGRAQIGGLPWCDHSPERDSGGPPIDPHADPGPRPFGRKPPLPEPKPASPAAPAPATMPAPAPPVTALWLAFQRAQRAFDAAIIIATEHHDAAVTEAAQHRAKLARHHAPAMSLEAAEKAVERVKQAPVEAIPEAETLAVAKAAYIAAFRTTRDV